MDRRDFLSSALRLSSGLAATTVVSTGVQAGLFEDLLTGAEKTEGTLLDRIDVVLRNAHGAFRGLYQGYGEGIRQILEGTRGPLPTTPPRPHAGWPHVHCVCHCTTVASLGPEDGVAISEIGGMADEVNQAMFAKLYYDVVLPLTWSDMTAKYESPKDAGKAVREMKFVINYAFGDDFRQRRALKLASLADKSNRATLMDYRDLIFGLIDALESAWQKSDFHDNVIGRQGGLKCPQSLSPDGKREWCSGWCTQKGVPTDVAEGPGTKRPWGPFHPLFPGPIPTMHDAIHGSADRPVDPKLNVPPPDYAPLQFPKLKGMYALPVEAAQMQR